MIFPWLPETIQFPVNSLACTQVPGVPLATQRQPAIVYLLAAAPSSTGARFATKSPWVHVPVVGAAVPYW